MRNQLCYKAYGLTLLSELPLPGPEIAEGKPDVSICFGTASASPTYGGSLAAEQTFFLRIPGIAAYSVCGGSVIVIEPEGMYDEAGILLYLLGSVFCALLQQRGFLVLHGASVQIGKQGVLLTGPSGIGKSTLATALYERGYRILADDLCAVKTGEHQKPQIVPGFPSLKLWKDAAERFGQDIGVLAQVKKDLEKYRIEAGRGFSESVVSLDRVFTLHRADVRSVDIVEVSGLRKLETMLKNTYRHRFLKAQGVESLHFQQCAAVASYARVFDAVRPESGFCADELATAIEGCLGGDDQ